MRPKSLPMLITVAFTTCSARSPRPVAQAAPAAVEQVVQAVARAEQALEEPPAPALDRRPEQHQEVQRL